MTFYTPTLIPAHISDNWCKLLVDPPSAHPPILPFTIYIYTYPNPLLHQLMYRKMLNEIN